MLCCAFRYLYAVLMRFNARIFVNYRDGREKKGNRWCT